METCFDNFERCHYVTDGGGDERCPYFGNKLEKEQTFTVWIDTGEGWFEYSNHETEEEAYEVAERFENSYVDASDED